MPVPSFTVIYLGDLKIFHGITENIVLLVVPDHPLGIMRPVLVVCLVGQKVDRKTTDRRFTASVENEK